MRLIQVVCALCALMFTPFCASAQNWGQPDDQSKWRQGQTIGGDPYYRGDGPAATYTDPRGGRFDDRGDGDRLSRLFPMLGRVRTANPIRGRRVYLRDVRGYSRVRDERIRKGLKDLTLYLGGIPVVDESRAEVYEMASTDSYLGRRDGRDTQIDTSRFVRGGILGQIIPQRVNVRTQEERWTIRTSLDVDFITRGQNGPSDTLLRVSGEVDRQGLARSDQRLWASWGRYFGGTDVQLGSWSEVTEERMAEAALALAMDALESDAISAVDVREAPTFEVADLGDGRTIGVCVEDARLLAVIRRMLAGSQQPTVPILRKSRTGNGGVAIAEGRIVHVSGTTITIQVNGQNLDQKGEYLVEFSGVR